MTIRNKRQKLRFMAVGAFNTTIDFGLLFGLKSLGLPEIPAILYLRLPLLLLVFFSIRKLLSRLLILM